jgi:DNA-binding transcriptional regulator YiaG
MQTATTTSEELAAEIKKARGDRTQRVASIAFECTEKTLGSWEAARSRPTERKHLRALAAAGVPLDLLLADDDSTEGE